MGRIALVSGGTRGIGRAISVALKDKGYTVVASFAGNKNAAAVFHEQTGIQTSQFDVADFTSCETAVKSIEQNIGGIDVLINNAGITRDVPLHKMNQNQWNEVIATNLTGAFNLSRLVVDGMRSRKFGRVISISSINGQKGQFGQTNYAAAKAGVIGFTKSFALETAAKGITVNAIAPGYIATEMVMAVPKEVLETKIIPQIPVGRLGEASEIARCVTFLASDDAGFITGSTLSANGGQYLT